MFAVTFAFEESFENYVLKTPGKEEYLIEDVPLSQYMYIRELVSQDHSTPIPLVIVHREKVQVDIDNIYADIEQETKQMRNSFSQMTLSKKALVSSWNINEKFKVLLGSLSRCWADADGDRGRQRGKNDLEGDGDR